VGGWFASWNVMRARRLDGIDQAAADRLLAGRSPDPRLHGLGLLLDAAKAPARDEELAGEQEMVHRMVAARRVASAESPVRRRNAHGRPPSRRAIVTLATGLASVALAGVAAWTGALPDPLQQRVHDMVPVIDAPSPGSHHSSDDRPAATTPTSKTSPIPATSPTSANSPTPDPASAQAQALCRTWSSAGRDPNGRAMDGQSWRTLVAVAGGNARVPALCAALLASPTPRAAASGPGSSPGAGAGSVETTAGMSRAGGGVPATASHPSGGKGRGPSTPDSGKAR
jgi:hypothetical protein